MPVAISTLPPTPAASRAAARTSALLAVGALIVVGLAWELWLAPTGRGTWAVKVLPLAIAAAGLWRGRLRTFRSTCLLVWLYVCEGLVRATSEAGTARVLACVQIALSLLLFASCVRYVRAGRTGAAAHEDLTQ